ncbi:MAG: hypothetical protein ACI4WS_07265, partial [Oscillospiraceae bacterium]
MKDITVGQNIAPLAPIKSAPLIRPLCAPLDIGDDFTEEISSHWKAGINSLWERLGLVYLEEAKPDIPRTDNGFIVNNFTQQIIFQLFSQKNISRLIETNQPGFVLIDKVYREAAGGKNLTGAKLSTLLEKRLSEKTELSRELERVLLLASEGQRELPELSVSDDMAVLTVTEILRKAAAEKKVSERQLMVSERILQQNTKHEQLNTLLKELSGLVSEGGEGSAMLTESILERITGFLRTDSAPARSVILRAAAEKAAELVQENYTDEQAKQTAADTVSVLFRSELARRESAEQLRELAGAAKAYPAVGSAEKAGLSGEGAEPVAAVGQVVPDSKYTVSEAALFLLEQTEGQPDTDSGDGLRLARLPEREVRGLIRQNAEKYASEITRISGGSVERAVSEAVDAALAMKKAARTANAAHAVHAPYAPHSANEVSAAGSRAGGSVGTSAAEKKSSAGMASSLMRRAAGYVTDKLEYEKRTAMSELPAAGGGEKYSEFRLLERAERFVPGSNTSGGSLAETHYLVSNSSGVYYAVSADRVVLNENSVVDGDFDPALNQSGAAMPFDGGFTQNSVDITYTENTSADVQNITNNTANVQNVAGNTVNQQVNEAPAVGAAKPVDGS